MNSRLENDKEVYAKRGQELHKLLVAEWDKFRSTYSSELAGWRWKWSTSRSRFGSCHHGDKLIRISNRALLDPDYSKAIETLRHEVAHALAGLGAKHGPIWKEWAVRCGATPRSCGMGSEDAEAVPHRWELVFDQTDGSVEIFRRYQARPNRQFRIKLPTLSIVGRPETKGKLRLRWWSEVEKEHADREARLDQLKQRGKDSRGLHHIDTTKDLEKRIIQIDRDKNECDKLWKYFIDGDEEWAKLAKALKEAQGE